MKRTSALLAVFLLLACFMLASLWLAAGDAPVRADEPEGLLIPRHRVGHRAKVQNLDTLVAQGGDPLAGNRRLVADDEIFLMTKESSGSLDWKYYDVNHDLDTPTLINEHLLDGDSPALATGNFDGDNLTDFVAVRRRDKAVYLMLGYFRDGLTGVTYDFDTGEVADGPPRVATGDFDGDGQDEIVIAWEGGSQWLNLKVYDPVGSIHPVARGKLYDEKVGHTRGPDVATGDFDGDGTPEVALAWHDPDLNLNAKIYDVDSDGNLTAKAKKAAGEGNLNAAVATGDLDGSGTDQIVVADVENLKILQVSNDLGTLTLRGSHDWNCVQFVDFHSIAVDVATGDFNTDGLDEIVTACRSNGTLNVDVWASGSTLDLVKKAGWAKWYEDFGQNILAVGDLNHDLRSEIVLAWTLEECFLSTCLDQKSYLAIFQVSTDLGTITRKVTHGLGTGAPQSHVPLALGDLNGDSVQVGKPTYSRVTEAKQLLATINEPAKHLDTVDGTEYDINVSEVGACTADIGPPCTFARYGTETKTTTDMSMSISRDWGFSSELGVDLDLVDASLKLSYGEGFEKTTSSLQEGSFGHEADAGEDDVIIRTEADYDVWEYPVYSDTTGTIQGYIAVVFPVKANPSCTEDCAVVSKVATIAGTDPLSYYAPNHENHDILSYSQVRPGDMITPVKTSSSRFYVDGTVNTFTVVWSDVKEDETKKTRKQDTEFGAGVDIWGIKAKVDGTYSKEQVSTHKVSFEQTTSIYLRVNNIEQAQEDKYVMDPYVYWSSDDGHLALDYAVRPETNASNPTIPATWWQLTYDKPDPAFNLPWKYSTTPGYPLLTKEITFDPHSTHGRESGHGHGQGTQLQRVVANRCHRCQRRHSTSLPGRSRPWRTDRSASTRTSRN